MVLLSICLFHLITNLTIIYGTTAPLVYEQVWGSYPFFEQSLLFRANFVRGQLPPTSALYPPLPTVPRAILQVILGPAPQAAVVGTALTSLVLLVCVYLIGDALYGPKEGLLATFLTAVMPGIFAFSRTLYAEVPLAAMVALTIALMLKSKHFTHQWYTVAFGLSIGLGFLTKWTYPLYVGGPIVLYAVSSFRKRSPLRKADLQWLARLVLPVIASLALAAAWYAPNLEGILSMLAAPGSLASTVTAPHFWTGLLGPILILAAVLTLLSPRSWRSVGRNLLLMLLLWFALPYIVFNLFGYPNSPRFIIPSLPALALALAFWTAHVDSKWGRRVVTFMVIGGLVQFLVISYVVSPLQPEEIDIFGVPSLDVRDWKGDDLLAELSTLQKGKDVSRILVASESTYSGKLLFLMMALKENCQDDPATCPFMIADLGASTPAINGSLCSSCLGNSSFFQEQFLSSDIVLLEQDDKDLETALVKTARTLFLASSFGPETELESVLNAWEAVSPTFDFVASYKLPTGNELGLYVRRAHSELLLRRERPLDADSALQFVPDEFGKTYGSSTGDGLLFRFPLRETAPRVEENANKVLIPPKLRKIPYPLRGGGNAYLVITFSEPIPAGFDVFLDGNLSARVSPGNPPPHRFFATVMVSLPPVQHIQVHEVNITSYNVLPPKILAVRVVCPGKEECVGQEIPI